MNFMRPRIDMPHPLIPCLAYPLYLLIRLFVHFFRDIIWKPRTNLWKCTEPGEPKKCAHVLQIKWRYKFDIIIQSNKPEDFVLFHESFEYPEYVLKDEVSLYHINMKEAMFVECPKDCSVWDLKAFSFSREAQFRLAKKVIILPISEANALARVLGKPTDNIIFMGTTSRCGSTLLCRMFQSTGHYISYVEPCALDDLLMCADHEDDPDVAELITTTVTLLCKPRIDNVAMEGHVIKITPSSTKLIPSLHRLFPNAHYLFIYRNLVPVMKSLARIVPSLPYTHLLSRLRLLSRNWAEEFSRYHRRQQDLSFMDRDFISPYSKIFPICLLPVICYFIFLKQGINIYAVRYEDLIQDPEGSLKRLFYICGVSPAYLAKALIPLDQDAQEKSPLSRTKIVSLRIPDFTEKDRDQVKKICECYKIPNVLVEKVYPKTITLSGDFYKAYMPRLN